MKETIKLNENCIGKRFIRRDYSVVKIVKRNALNNFSDEFGMWYFNDGAVVKDGESPYDLMSQIAELSTLNPYKIDEERFEKIFLKKYNLVTWGGSGTLEMIQEYNSTIEDHQVLQPLDDKVPAWFLPNHVQSFRIDTWNELIQHYGTPTKKELVSVEELEKEIFQIYGNHKLACSPTFPIAQHIIDTYSLNPPKREWHEKLKVGEKFNYKNPYTGEISTETFYGSEKVFRLFCNADMKVFCFSDGSTPYTEPSIHDKFMASLSDEQKKMYEEMKEVKNEL